MSDKDLIPESQVETYRELQQHLHTLPVGYPATKSGVELRLLKRVFTPEEAKIASHMKFSYDNLEPLESIHERVKELGYTKEELKFIANPRKTVEEEIGIIHEPVKIKFYTREELENIANPK